MFLPSYSLLQAVFLRREMFLQGRLQSEKTYFTQHQEIQPGRRENNCIALYLMHNES